MRIRAFTLIELLVTIAIVGVLAALVLVAINPARRLAQARDSGRKSDIGAIATALQAYFTSNNGSYPTALQGLAQLVVSQDLKNNPNPPNPEAAPGTIPAGIDTVYEYSVSPGGCNGTAPPCAESTVWEILEAPVVAGTPLWCFRTVTGTAIEALACTAP